MREKLLRRNYVTLETPASIRDILWQWKAKFQMLGFDSPKQCVQGSRAGQELVRELLVPPQPSDALRVKSSRKTAEKNFKGQVKEGSTLTLSAEQAIIFQLRISGLSSYLLLSINLYQWPSEAGKIGLGAWRRERVHFHFPWCSLNTLNELLLDFFEVWLPLTHFKIWNSCSLLYFGFVIAEIFQATHRHTF